MEIPSAPLTLLTLFDMLEKSCVMAVVAYLLIRTDYFGRLFLQPKTTRQEAVLCCVFIGIAIYGALNGLQIGGSLVSMLHSGAILAGLLGGMKFGVIVGVVSAAIRYLVGGDTLLVSMLATLLAGVLAGMAYRFKKRGTMITTLQAILFTAGFELFVRGVPFLLADSPEQIRRQLSIIITMLCGNVMMVASFFFVVRLIGEARENRLLRERIATELKMAREIQMSLVPTDFGPFRQFPALAVYGFLKPAREVGGDVYDFFFLERGRFCFMIGDVSGKGMPAALFMAAVRTLFKAQTEWSSDLKEIVGRVNRELCRGNEAMHFVTLFCGILELESGKMTYCNAGHNPPYLRARDGSLQRLDKRHGPAAGVCETALYSSGECTVLPGELLLLYTDGVTEAENEKAEMFTTQRLETVLTGLNASGPKAAIEEVMQSVGGFSGEAEQSDDITLLAWSYDSAKEPE